MTVRRRGQSAFIGLLAMAFLVAASSEGGPRGGQPIMRDPELEALQEAVRWPGAEIQTVVTLVGRFIASHRDQEAHAYFQERAGARPDEPLFLALEGFFQARAARDVSLSEALAALRRRALDGLRARHQTLNPFKFVIYSEWAGAGLAPVE